MPSNCIIKLKGERRRFLLFSLSGCMCTSVYTRAGMCCWSMCVHGGWRLRQSPFLIAVHILKAYYLPWLNWERTDNQLISMATLLPGFSVFQGLELQVDKHTHPAFTWVWGSKLWSSFVPAWQVPYPQSLLPAPVILIITSKPWTFLYCSLGKIHSGYFSSVADTYTSWKESGTCVTECRSWAVSCNCRGSSFLPHLHLHIKLSLF